MIFYKDLRFGYPDKFSGICVPKENERMFADFVATQEEGHILRKDGVKVPIYFVEWVGVTDNDTLTKEEFNGMWKYRYYTKSGSVRKFYQKNEHLYRADVVSTIGDIRVTPPEIRERQKLARIARGPYTSVRSLNRRHRS